MHNSAVATNYEQAFAARPEVYDAWRALVTAIKAVVGRPIAEA